MTARTRRDRLADLGLSLGLAVIALGPFLFRRGFALRGDMVFVPHQPWKAAWLALDGSAARFVPGDAVLSMATAVLPGDLVQKGLLLGALVLAGAGAGRLVRDYGFVARAAAIVVFCWNPWVLERLLIGQWGAVVGYACLPWLVGAAAVLRDDVRRGWPALVCWLGFAALWSPPSALAASLTAACVVLCAPRGRPRLRPFVVTVAASAAVNLPWLVPSLLVRQRLTATGEQFDAFAARAESGAGLVPSLVSLGGIWKTSVVPDERTLALVVALSCLTTVTALAFLRRARAAATPSFRATTTGLGLLAVVSILLAAVPALPPVTTALDDAALSVPALGIIRDSHRFLAPAVLVLLPGIAAATQWLWRARPGAEGLRVVAVLLAIWPVLCLPSMAWGLRGALAPVVYPDEWFRVADELESLADEGKGAASTVVLPWRGSYRGYDWNADTAVLDPAPRFFEGDVLVDDRLYVDDLMLDNEDPRLADVTEALGSEDPASGLRNLGVTQVLVETGNGVLASDVPDGRILHTGRDLLLVELGDATGSGGYPEPNRWVVLAADVGAALAVLVAVTCIIRRRVYGERDFVASGREPL